MTKVQCTVCDQIGLGSDVESAKTHVIHGRGSLKCPGGKNVKYATIENSKPVPKQAEPKKQPTKKSKKK